MSLFVYLNLIFQSAYMAFDSLIYIVYFHLIISISCFYHYKNAPIPPKGDYGEPLFVTPLLETGKINEARFEAKVEPLVGSVKSYSGFFTVNKTCCSNIFFWFFPAVKSPEKAPVVVWLQGGPGVSSLFGLFAENGPYQIEENSNISLRRYSWTKTLSILYIDNPVGTGYSFTEKDGCYAKNEKDVGVNLYNTVQQFFQLFPDLLQNEFYVTGESYGGKYAPALAYEIHIQNLATADSLKINLKGIALGNGFSDPEHMLDYGQYLYEIGLIDTNAKVEFDEKRDKAVKYIRSNQYDEALIIFDTLMNNDLTSYPSLFTNITGFKNYYNYLYTNETDIDVTAALVQQDFVRQRIHVGNLPFHVDRTVEKHLRGDIMKSVAPMVEVLVENYKFMVYNGQLDIIVAYPLTVGFLENLKWSGAQAYKTASRHIWKVNDEIAGYVKIVRNLVEVLVRNAGHMVPADQPQFAYDLINRFVFEKPFY